MLALQEHHNLIMTPIIRRLLLTRSRPRPAVSALAAAPPPHPHLRLLLSSQGCCHEKEQHFMCCYPAVNPLAAASPAAFRGGGVHDLITALIPAHGDSSSHPASPQHPPPPSITHTHSPHPCVCVCAALARMYMQGISIQSTERRKRARERERGRREGIVKERRGKNTRRGRKI